MKIETAKFRLYNKSPFWGSILFNLPIKEINLTMKEAVEKGDCMTAGVDGENLYVNMEFWNKLNDKEQLGIMCHEIGHLFLGHIWRKGFRNDICVDPKTGQQVMLWNLAADVTVNNMILEEGRFSLPKGCFLRKNLKDKSTEEIYEILKKQIPQMTPKELQDLIDSVYNDKSKWGKGKGGKKQSRADAKEQEAKWKNIGKQAVEQAKQRGTLPAGIERMFEELEPKEDWRQILLSYVQPYWNDYSFNPTDRRFMEEDFMLPDIKMGEKIDWIAVGVDTSGSIGQNELNRFLSEVKAILSSFDKVKVKLTFCDAAASPFTELEEFDKAAIEVTGGGGTDFRPVFNLIKQEHNAPLALIYFTDLQGEFPANQPDYDVIWVNTTKDLKAPFGKCLPYEI